MKIDGLEWMDWLHKTRQKMEDERKRRGQSEVEWLREAQARARADQAGDRPLRDTCRTRLQGWRIAARIEGNERQGAAWNRTSCFGLSGPLSDSAYIVGSLRIRR